MDKLTREEIEQTLLSPAEREVFRQKAHKAVANYLGKSIPNIKLNDIDERARQLCQVKVSIPKDMGWHLIITGESS